MEPRKVIIKNPVKINSSVANTMFSSRFLNNNDCIQNPSTSRNIFISHSVLPETLNHSQSTSCNIKKKDNLDTTNIIVKNHSNNSKYIKLSNFNDNLRSNMNDRLLAKQNVNK